MPHRNPPYNQTRKYPQSGGIFLSLGIPLTEKYRPETTKDIVGCLTQIRVGQNFLRWWQRGKPYTKALLFIGKEGTGKTTLAIALANDFALPVHITDAGDERRKEQMIALEKSSLVSSFESGMRLIVIDEVDSLNKKTQQRLVKAIEKSLNPIILIANDRKKLIPAIRQNTQIIEFKQPNHEDKVSLITRIVGGEGVKMGIRDIENLANTCDTLRQIVISLQGTPTTGKDIFGNSFEQVQSILDGDPITVTMGPKDLRLWLYDNTHDYEAVSTADLMIGRAYKGLPSKYPKAILSLVRKEGAVVEFPPTFSFVKSAKKGKKGVEKKKKKEKLVEVQRTNPIEYMEKTIEGREGLGNFFV